jgi:hypothetical protein
MADYFDGKKFGSVVAFGPFTAANVEDDSSNVDLAYGQSSYAIMPVGGSVIAVSVYANAAVTHGSGTVRAHSSSTELADTGYPAPVLNATNTQVSYASVRPGAVTFSAGDKLGLSIVTDTTWSPETLEVDGWLFVQFNPS